MTEPPDKLLDLIYDAATEEELWTPALIEIADLTGSVGGYVFGVENRVRLVTFSFQRPPERGVAPRLPGAPLRQSFVRLYEP